MSLKSGDASFALINCSALTDFFYVLLRGFWDSNYSSLYS